MASHSPRLKCSSDLHPFDRTQVQFFEVGKGRLDQFCDAYLIDLVLIQSDAFNILPLDLLYPAQRFRGHHVLNQLPFLLLDAIQSSPFQAVCSSLWCLISSLNPSSPTLCNDMFSCSIPQVRYLSKTSTPLGPTGWWQVEPRLILEVPGGYCQRRYYSKSVSVGCILQTKIICHLALLLIIRLRLDSTFVNQQLNLTTPSQMKEHLQADDSTRQLSIILTLLFLTFYLLLSAFTAQRKFPIHRTSIAIVIGILAGVVISNAAPKTYHALVNLDQFIVFSILFPPMIFASGYTFNTRVIKQNIKYIVTFGVLGTFLSFFVSWGLINAVNELNLVKDLQNINNYRTLSAWQILLLAACLCSIDTISSEQTIPQHRLPRLYSIIFGQDVLKDAVTIVLFRAVLHLQEQESSSKLVLHWYTIFRVLLNFIVLIAGSVLSGVVSAFIATFATKKLRFVTHDQGVTETGLLFLIGFLQYILTQLLDFSGSISLLLYGILLSHYNTYNLSPSGQKTSVSTFTLISNICEGLLFLIMGIMMCQADWLSSKGSQQKITHSYIFCLSVMVVLVVARFINVYVLGWLGRAISKRFRQRFNISNEELLFVFLSGMVRGATPFVLFTSVSFGSDSGHYSKNQGLVLKTTIIFVIAFTSIVLNSLIPFIYKKKKGKLIQEHKKRQQECCMNEEPQTKGKLSSFQEKYIKPLMIVDYAVRKHSIEEQEQQKKREWQEEVRNAERQDEELLTTTTDNFSDKSSSEHLIN